MTDKEIYNAGYRAGHDDGYNNRRKLPWHASDLDWVRGYYAGYAAGEETQRYANEHGGEA